MTLSSSLDLSKVAIILPTWNAERFFDSAGRTMLAQGLRADQVQVIDSGSTDGTVTRARSFGFLVHEIAQSEFDHGGTRQLGVALVPWAEYVVFMTHDAVPQGERCVRDLLSAFSDEHVGAAYGRQLPRREATLIEAHARLFNYPAQSSMRDLDSRRVLGLKSIFLSNSFAAYRREALLSVGGFPRPSIFGEDMVITARLHLAGWKTAYVAEATVIHSHRYSPTEEFQRYFDIGVLHARESRLLADFGQASGEGRRFVLSELGYLFRNGSAHSWLAAV